MQGDLRGRAAASELIERTLAEFGRIDLSRYVTGQCLSVCGGKVLTPS